MLGMYHVSGTLQRERSPGIFEFKVVHCEIEARSDRHAMAQNQGLGWRFMAPPYVWLVSEIKRQPALFPEVKV